MKASNGFTRLRTPNSSPFGWSCGKLKPLFTLYATDK